MATPSPKYEKGSEVRLRNDSTRQGVVVDVLEYHGGLWYYRVNFGNGQRTNLSEIDLEEICYNDESHDILRKGALGNFTEFQRNLLYHKLLKTESLTNNIYAFNVSRTIFFPYQFKPLLKFIESPNNRILVADEVGLGKTIEGALIYMEMKARQTMRRVLVVCPSNLKLKWQGELEKRFAEEFAILNTGDFLKFIDKYEEFPPQAKIKGIIALESLRQQQVIERLKEVVMPEFDLLIVDEAHHLRNRSTKQSKVAKSLCDNADGIVFLTASPIHLGNEDLFSLLNILDEDNFPDEYTAKRNFSENTPVVLAQRCLSSIPANLDSALVYISARLDMLDKDNNPSSYSLAVDMLDQIKVLREIDAATPEYTRNLIKLQRDLSDLNLLNHIFNRTKKKEVIKDIVTRRAHSIKIELSEIEKQFYDKVVAYVKAEASKRLERLDCPHIIQWIINTPQRRVASSIPAMVDYYKNNLGSYELDLGEDDTVLDTDEYIDDYELINSRKALKKIIDEWQINEYDSKFNRLLQILNEKKRDGKLKIVIFAFFKDTLKYLEKTLRKEGFNVLIVTGETPMQERYNLIEKFKTHAEYEILLSSRVCSEGLDLQFCNMIVNYDLPWNPMEIEQRIGRIDRIGQKSSVIHIFNFCLEGTIEERILERLFKRIHIFEGTIGELEPIMGKEIRELMKDLIMKNLSPEEEIKRIEQTARIIEGKKHDIEKLEKNAAKFIGLDNYFEKQIETIQKTRRYVTGKQLKIFVMQFIREVCPRTRFDYPPKIDEGFIYPDNEFKRLISELNLSTDLARFFDGKSGVNITFSNEVAFDNSSIEFIHNAHPLVKLIVSYYKENSQKYNNAYHFNLRTQLLPKGKYFFFIYSIKVNSAKPKHVLETIFIDTHYNLACSEETGEIILGEMLEFGENSEYSNFQIDEKDFERLYRIAKDEFFRRMVVHRNETAKNNDLLVDGQISSIRKSYEKKIKKFEEIIQNPDHKYKKSYLNMIEGRIDRKKNEMTSRINKLESRKEITLEHDELATGILEVID